MEARMKNPAMLLPGTMKGIQALQATVDSAGLPASTIALSHLRASQINGCTVCTRQAECGAEGMGETPERILSVANWR